MSDREYQLPPLPTTDNRPLWDIWLSGFQLPSLTAADELGIFTYLADHPSRSGEIASALRLGSRSIEALLNLLTALGFIARRNGIFHLNELSRCYLLPESPHYWGGVLHTVRDMPVSHSMIIDAVRSDSFTNIEDNAGPRKFTDEWKQSTLSAEQARRFTEKMHSHGFSSALALARFQFFDDIRSLLDIGGGSGCYSIALAAAHPLMRCTIAELPPVCQCTIDYVERYGLSDRIKIAPIDMFREEWPYGHDAIFMSDILHDWSLEHCLYLLQRAYNALPSGGRIFIHEVLLEDNGIGPLTANAYSLAMLMVAEGKQFSGHEITSLLKQAGFNAMDITPTYGYYSLITARKN